MRPLNAAQPAAKRASFLALAAFALAGCGSPPRETFDLARSAPAGEARVAARPLRTALAVSEPEAIMPVNSDRIVIRTGPQEVSNLAEAQWADQLPRLVQSRLIEGFDVGASTGSVGRPGGAVDHVLSTEIRRFEIDARRQEAVVEIAAKIVDERTNRMRPGRVFTARTPAPHTTGPAAAQALEDALETALRQIIRWTTTQI